MDLDCLELLAEGVKCQPEGDCGVTTLAWDAPAAFASPDQGWDGWAQYHLAGFVKGRIAWRPESWAQMPLIDRPTGYLDQMGVKLAHCYYRYSFESSSFTFAEHYTSTALPTYFPFPRHSHASLSKSHYKCTPPILLLFSHPRFALYCSSRADQCVSGIPPESIVHHRHCLDSYGHLRHLPTPVHTKPAKMAMLTGENPRRFRKHVTFSNVHLGEPTKFNFPCYTLVVRHLGYQSKRRSRTFMVGIDDHQYSDEALQWLFERFVDDGDEIVCVRVIEKDVRLFEGDKRLDEFQREANAEVAKIQAKCGDKKAISIVLEYAVGKLHLAFQRLVSNQPTLPPLRACGSLERACLGKISL